MSVTVSNWLQHLTNSYEVMSIFWVQVCIIFLCIQCFLSMAAECLVWWCSLSVYFDHSPFFYHAEDWYEQLYPLIITLKDCVSEVVDKAKTSMTFVVLQELACDLPQCLRLTFRRDMVFSQAVSSRLRILPLGIDTIH